MPDPSSSPTEIDVATTRRWLLRGGAVAAGAAVVAAAAPGAARAADGDMVELGAENSSTSPTAISIGDASGSANPTLVLENADGPTLYLQPQAADYAVALEEGQLANTKLGPVVGVESEFGLTTTYLVTGVDLAMMPTPYPLPTPRRLLDTRTAAGRSRVVRTSSGAYDASFRLKPGAWLDVEVAVEETDSKIPGAYLNVTATGSLANGYLSVYKPQDAFPGTSTLNFQTGVTIANSAFTATGVAIGKFVVRVRASATTHVVLDLTGITVEGIVETPIANAAKTQRRSHNSTGAAAITSRLRSTLAARVLDRLSR